MLKNLTKREPILIRILHEPDHMYKSEWTARLVWHNYQITQYGNDPMMTLKNLLAMTEYYFKNWLVYDKFLEGYCDNEPEKDAIKYI